MFSKKQTSLFQKATSATPSKVESKNPFIQAGLKKSAETSSLGNGALKYVTTGSDFIDQFSKVSTYKAPRSFEEISSDMRLLWSQNPFLTLCLVFYIRMITRVVSLFDGRKTETAQRGQGLKHEGIMRMLWVAVNYPDTFWKNIGLFVSIGSWNDIFQMLSYDLQYNTWKGRVLDWKKMGQLILAGLENPQHSELIKKYLPKAQFNRTPSEINLHAQADAIIGKWLIGQIWPDFIGCEQVKKATFYKKYRLLKSSGTAHQWQQLISKHLMESINFDTIHGRALAQLAGGKFLKNNGLEAKYQAWIDSKPVAKYTGFVYELFAPFGVNNHATKLSTVQEATINKQFLGLVETARNGMSKEDTGLIVVIDSSGSMMSAVPGTKSSSYSVAKSMALYFSYLLKGPFQDHFLEFSNETIMKTWKGTTPVDKYRNEHSAIVAGTNFQSVAHHFSKILRSGVSEKDFPKGILCVSDGCFNHPGTNMSNVKALRAALRQYGFSQEFVDNFKVILWDIPNGHYGGKAQTAFEEFADCPNLIHMSGLDPAVVAFLTGGVKGQTSTPSTSEQLFEAVMDQEVLKMIEV